MPRRLFVALHRWFGLFTAVFLFIAGATGALIAWDHELDAWLNPELTYGSSGPQRSPLDLADALEASEPRLRVTFLPLLVEEGHVLSVFVEPRLDPATGQPYDLDYNQVAIDPVDGQIAARRYWGAASLDRRSVLSFLYKLHYSLHLPSVGGFDTGVWLMGIVAIVWLLDGFVALYLSFPSFSVWRRSLAFRWRAGGVKLLFDLHRSSGVWVWPLLVILAFTAVSMNLGDEVVRPALARITSISPDPFERPLSDVPIEPRLSRADIAALAATDGQKRGWNTPVGGIFYAPRHGLYGVGFWSPGNDHGDGTLGNPWLYYDAITGTSSGELVPGQGTAGDVFLQMQFPLHSGRWFGLPGRLAVSGLGLAVALLSATGVILWVRRQLRRARPSPGHRELAEGGPPRPLDPEEVV